MAQRPFSLRGPGQTFNRVPVLDLLIIQLPFDVVIRLLCLIKFGLRLRESGCDVFLRLLR